MTGAISVEDEGAEKAVLDGLGDPPPVAQRTIDDVQESMSADVARLQRAETHGEFARAELHVDGDEAELVQRLDQQMVAGRRQRDDDGVDAMNARIAHQLVDRTEDGVTHATLRQGGRLVVVDAEDARTALGRIQATQQALGDRSGADDGDDLAEASGAVPYPHLVMQDDTARGQQHDAAREPKGDPRPVHRCQRLDQGRCEEQGGQRQQPAEQRTADGSAQIGELVEPVGACKAQKIQAEQ